MILAVLLLLCASTVAVPVNGGQLHERIIRAPSTVPVSQKAYQELRSKAVNTNELIFGGTKAYPGLIPMQVDLVITMAGSDNKTFLCGGTLISRNHVLTAGHCAEHIAKPTYFMVGSVSEKVNTSNTQWREVEKVTLHPNFMDNKLDIHHDVAVLSFNPPVTLNHDVTLANILRDDQAAIRNSKWAIVSGDDQTAIRNSNWAIVSGYGTTHSRRIITSSQLCAGKKEQGVGGGDSGGPLLTVDNHTIYQLGITSYGSANPFILQHMQDQIPSVFARVSHYCDFIESTTKGAFRCQ
uniref:Peptidase S1 domain-containing protein n=1 Tax=Steinernema glaseri TaxID=37863 RepID=A0A1I7XWU1_9BILA